MASLTTVALDLRRLVEPDHDDDHLLVAFAENRQESAFAALVRRYAGLVMGVCRRTLRHEQDAEDAFQATFLVLARNARSIRRSDSLAAWLHGVAYRIAMNAKRSLARQREKDRKGARGEATASREDISWGEVQGLLDAEVQKLPEAYRRVFVLCCLQEKTKPEAATLLGVKEGTVSSRLARAKERLHEALSRRGVTLTALMATLGLRQSSLSAAVLKATAKVAVAGAAGAGGVVPARVAVLAAGETMLGTKAKMATALAVFVGLALAPLTARTGGEKPGAPGKGAMSARPDGHEKQAEAAGMREVEGLVLDPDGNPLKGAAVAARVARLDGGSAKTAATAVTGADGRFRLAHDAGAHQYVIVVATAPGFGPQWAAPTGTPMTMKLVKDQPITAKVVDLEGRPVPNARLRVLRVEAHVEGSLASGLAKEASGEAAFSSLDAGALPEGSRSADADAKGYARLAGLGHERRVVAVVEGPTIASKEVWVLTGPAPGLTPDASEERTSRERQRPVARAPGAPSSMSFSSIRLKPARLTLVYAATFTHPAAPTRPVVGVVRDRATREPIAGATVRSEWLTNNAHSGADFVRAKTDAAGAFRLVGLPMGKENRVVVEPPAGLPYFALEVAAPDSSLAEPAAMDVALPRGVWAEGRVTVCETGQPLPHASVRYFTSPDNPGLAALGGTVRPEACWAGADGRYRLPVLPGRGAIVARGGESFLTLREQPELKKENVPALEAVGVDQFYYHHFARIDPGATAACVRHDIALARGETFKVKLVDPDGKPVVGARSFRAANGWMDWSGPTPSAEHVVKAFNPKAPRRVEFVHLERNLAAVFEAPKDGTKEVVVRLRKAGTVVGQLVDDAGKPRAGVQMLVYSPDFPGPRLHPAVQSRVRTNERGEFRVAGLQPSVVTYLLGPPDEAGIGQVEPKEGETKDLGKVKAGQ